MGEWKYSSKIYPHIFSGKKFQDWNSYTAFRRKQPRHSATDGRDELWFVLGKERRHCGADYQHGVGRHLFKSKHSEHCIKWSRNLVVNNTQKSDTQYFQRMTKRLPHSEHICFVSSLNTETKQQRLQFNDHPYPFISNKGCCPCYGWNVWSEIGTSTINLPQNAKEQTKVTIWPHIALFLKT